MTGQKPAIRTKIPMTIGENVPAYIITFDNLSDDGEHIAFVFDRAVNPGAATLVRVHSSCVTGDIFHSHRCDCGAQLDEAIARLDREGGVLIYLFQEGRGIGLKAKIDAYALQIGKGLDTFAANRAIGHGEDERSYKAASEILSALGVQGIELITNNPDKIEQLKSLGVNVVAVSRTQTHITDENRAYLQAKKLHGHTLEME